MCRASVATGAPVHKFRFRDVEEYMERAAYFLEFKPCRLQKASICTSGGGGLSETEVVHVVCERSELWQCFQGDLTEPSSSASYEDKGSILECREMD
jgi:hypothetical protein